MRIPAQIGGVQVKEIGAGAFAGNKTLTHVVIPEGVEALGEMAFDHALYLVDAKLPSTLKSIGPKCFYASGLLQIQLPEGLESIRTQAFMDANLTRLVIPDSVKTIEAEAFHRCQISDLTLGAGVETLGDRAFYSNSLKTLRFLMKQAPAAGTEALTGRSKEPSLTLQDGITEEAYNAYVALMAVQFPACVVNQPVLKVPFPALDAAAGAPFLGTWHGVAAFDGAEYYTMDLLGMGIDVTLNADGTGALIMEGEATEGCWYAENGSALFAPLAEGGESPDPAEAVPFPLDENGRMTIDFGGIVLLLENEAAFYAVPAIPEKPWPELDPVAAQPYVGVWEAVSYTMDGETYDAALIGPMTIILNADGTAQMQENGVDSGMELRWYAESDAAYFGPAMSAAAKLTPDGAGNLLADQQGAVILLQPYAEAPAIQGADELLGEWLDDVGNKLTLNPDGSMTVTYASDGYVRDFRWAVTDGAAVVTEGIWSGCPITLENGIVTITNGEGIYQLFSADGDLSAAYGSVEDPALSAVPVGPEGAAFLGEWTLESVAGMDAALLEMSIVLTLNQDGTCSMFDGFETLHNVWSVENDQALVDGEYLHLNEEGKLVMPAEGMEMVFTQGEIAVSAPSVSQPVSAEAEDFIGEWTLESAGGLSASFLEMTMVFTLNQDGTCSMFDGFETVYDVWSVENDQALIAGMYLYLNEEGKLVLSADGMDMVFTRGDISAAVPPVSQAVSAAAEDFCGEWTLESVAGMDAALLEMTIVLTLGEDGLCSMYDGTETMFDVWSYEDGQALVAGEYLHLNEEGKLVMPAEGMEMIFVKGESAPVNVALPESLLPYVGEWHMVYCATGGLSGDLRTMGLTGKLVLGADGTGSLSGVSDNAGSWYDDEGTVRFGEEGVPMTLLEDGFLQYGSQLAGYMIFSRDENASWSPAPAATVVPTPVPTAVPTAAPTAAPQAPADGSVQYAGTKYTCKTYTTFGQTMDASMLGAEYGVLFHENNTVDFTLAGFTVAALPYTVTAEGVHAINYYGTIFNCVPTDTGFDMDYYGTMTLHFVPAE